MKKSSRKKSGRGRDGAGGGLKKYRSKRDFHLTPEPKGSARQGRMSSGHALSFVVQKHAASHLHYDFRLEWNGLLKSWAVAKGPSYYPGDRRLAIEVEDHPLEYGGFEGIIPKCQYGGGTVMVWDRGFWKPEKDVAKGLREGSLKFTLFGEKLQGQWALVRMKHSMRRAAKPNWLLIKEHDGKERGPNSVAVVDEAPNSAVSGRDLREIAEARDAAWSSIDSHGSGGSRGAKRVALMTESEDAKSIAEVLRKLPREVLPEFIKPQLASSGRSPSEAMHRVHEIKLDGYRIQARIETGTKSGIRLLTRAGLDWATRMTSVAEALKVLPAQSAMLDGEVVVLQKNGTTSFANLQAALQEGEHYPLSYFAFDLLHLDGRNLRDEPLLVRKNVLGHLLQGLPKDGVVRMSEHITGAADKILSHACALGAEGIVSKLSQGRYVSGRSSDWVKMKCHLEQEFVIGGVTHRSNGTYGIGALLLGYYEGGKLIYAGRTGAGFGKKMHSILRKRLERLKRKTSPFVKGADGGGRGVNWVTPELVAQVSFSNWTADGLVRQAAFKGLREDKPTKSVRREESSAIPPSAVAEYEGPDRGNTAKDTRRRREKTEVVINGPDVLAARLTHRTKLLDKDSGLTKGELAGYYAAIAPYILRYIEGRPASLVRCAGGTEKKCFFQKHTNNTLPPGIPSIDITNPNSGETEPYITFGTKNDLMELAQLNVLEIHVWGARRESLEKPDVLMIDLDPDDSLDWKTLANAATEVRRRFKSYGLKSFLKTTGGKGLHVIAPIVPERSWSEVKEFSHRLVQEMESANRSLYLTRMTKAARKGRIYLDYLRNGRGATAVAPFSPRARAGVPVALPLQWSELKLHERPVFRVMDFADWKHRLNRDPWSDLRDIRQRLP